METNSDLILKDTSAVFSLTKPIAIELNEVQTEALRKLLEKYPDKDMTPDKVAKLVLVDWIIQNEAQLRASELRK